MEIVEEEDTGCCWCSKCCRKKKKQKPVKPEIDYPPPASVEVVEEDESGCCWCSKCCKKKKKKKGSNKGDESQDPPPYSYNVPEDDHPKFILVKSLDNSDILPIKKRFRYEVEDLQDRHVSDV